MQIATGETPAFFYRLMIPIFTSVYFGFSRITPKELAEHLIQSGWHGELPDVALPHLGFRIAPMGWSWAVWIAQMVILSVTVPVALKDTTAPPEVRFLTRDRMLIHGV